MYYNLRSRTNLNASVSSARGPRADPEESSYVARKARPNPTTAEKVKRAVEQQIEQNGRKKSKPVSLAHRILDMPVPPVSYCFVIPDTVYNLRPRKKLLTPPGSSKSSAKLAKPRIQLSTGNQHPLIIVDVLAKPRIQLSTGNQHPLIIVDVLTTLVEYLDCKNLKTVRLVHSSWNNAVTPRLVKKTELRLKHYNLLDLFKVYPFEKTRTEIRFPRAIPNTLLMEKIFDFDAGCLLKWFECYGQTIKCVKIRDYWIEQLQPSSPELAIEVLALLINVTTLKIGYEFPATVLKSQTGDKQYFAKLKMIEIDGPSLQKDGLLTLTRNLEVLKLSGDCNLLGASFNHEYLQNLVELNLSRAYITEEALLLLTTVKFVKLKRLVLESQPQPICLTTYMAFFRNIRETLEHLICSLGLEFLFRILPIEMKQLKKLEITSSDVVSIDFLRKFPKLEEFELRMQASNLFSVFVKLFPKDLQFQKTSLKKLELFDFAVVDGNFQALVKALPCLEVLNIHYPYLPPRLLNLTESCNATSTNDVVRNFEEIFSPLGELKKLVEFNFSIRERFFDNDNQDSNSFTDAITSYFCNMRELKKFTFVCDNGSYDLQEAAVTEGFLKAPALRYLKLEQFKMTPKVKSLIYSLRDRNVQVQVVRHLNPLLW